MSMGGCGNRRAVATPKLPPPPRIAQNRSRWCSASTWRISPAAVTTSAASRLSTVSPYRRERKPIPPPSVSPPIPTEAVSPNPVTNPCSATAAVYSPAVSPVCAQAVCPSTSTVSWRSRVRSSTIPPSVTLWPAPLCPPPRTASSRPLSRVRGDHLSHLGRGRRLSDRGRVAVHRSVEDGTGPVVHGVLRGDDPAVEICLELRDRLCDTHDHPPVLIVRASLRRRPWPPVRVNHHTGNGNGAATGMRRQQRKQRRAATKNGRQQRMGGVVTPRGYRGPPRASG